MELLEKIKQLFIKRSKVEVEILQGIDIENMFTSVHVADDIRARIKSCSSRKDMLLSEYEVHINDLALVQRIDNLPKEELEELESLSKAYSENLLEKEAFQKTVLKESSVPRYLEKYKDEIPKVIREIEEHEKKRQIIKNDLNILEGEKAEIHYNINRAKQSLSFLRILLIVLPFVVAIAALVLSSIYFVYHGDIFIPSMVIIVIIVFIIIWLYIFRRYMIFELKKNQKLQKREVELTNKTKIKYVNVQQFLDYEYKKYQVNSSEMLQLRWENYQRHTNNEARLKRISKNVASLIQDVDRLLLRNNLEDDSYVIEHIDYFTSKKGRNMLKDTVEGEIKSLKEEIEHCENDVKVLDKLLAEIGERNF